MQVSLTLPSRQYSVEHDSTEGNIPDEITILSAAIERDGILSDLQWHDNGSQIELHFEGHHLALVVFNQAGIRVARYYDTMDVIGEITVNIDVIVTDGGLL